MWFLTRPSVTLCVYVYVYVCMYVCMYVCNIYIHIYIYGVLCLLNYVKSLLQCHGIIEQQI